LIGRSNANGIARLCFEIEAQSKVNGIDLNPPGRESTANRGFLVFRSQLGWGSSMKRKRARRLGLKLA